MSQPKPFHVEVSDSTIKDLYGRLDCARILPSSPNRSASGMTSGYLQELVESWRQFDWRRREQWLNTHPQFTVEVDDADIHFVHRRSGREEAPTILVMHGWPHTFALQLDFADLLQDFHVVVPSLPGFAYSSPYRSGEWSTERVAKTMHLLMTEVIGYESYLTYGEDISADINDFIAARYPESVAGIIATHAHIPAPEERGAFAAPDELAFFERLAAWNRTEGGYAHIQGTRPDTVAAGLNDSPAGLLAWIVEKLVEWSDTPVGDPRQVEKRISRERILTEAMIYWTTQSIATSFRPYYESGDSSGGIASVTVPAAVFIQRHESDYPESFARNYYQDLRVFERLQEGGHFTVAEVPSVMADHVRFFAMDLGLF